MTEKQEQEQVEIGWRILNAAGEIISSGPVTVAEMASEVGEE